MKKLTKLFAVLLAACLAFPITGCGIGGGNTNEQIDADKTQLYVSNFDGGYGHEWLEKIKADFEEDYKDVSFEEGKVGVQVMITNHKNIGLNQTGSILSDENYVFMMSMTPYYELANTNQVMDISDVVNGTFDINTAMDDQSIPDVSEKDIINKFTDFQKSALKVNDKYYGIPHYEGYYGLTYDADLFNQKSYYFDEKGELGLKSDDTAYLSEGPDGVKGTYDDGLPRTYEEFYKLCDEIVNDGGVPIAWSGDYQFYVSNVVNQFIADYNGSDNEMLLFDFNGTSTDWVESISGKVATESEKAITPATGYEVFKQGGVYSALTWLEKMVRTDGYTYKDVFTDGVSHTQIQSEYLLSNKDKRLQPIAMLCEGIWWENEAKSYFDSLSQTYPNSGMYERKLKFMPLPKASMDKLGKTTLVESEDAYMVVRGNLDERYVPLVKLFLQYCNTTERLQEFTTTTNTPKALKYDLTDAQYNQLTPYGKSVLEMKNAEVNGEKYTDIVYQISNSSLYRNNKTSFRMYESLAYGTYSFPSTAFNDNKSLTAQTYFEGLYGSWKGKWNNYSNFFND